MSACPNFDPKYYQAGSSAGFTLLEVIVALSVFAIGLVGVATYSAKLMQDNELAREIQTVSYFADRHLAELQLAAAQSSSRVFAAPMRQSGEYTSFDGNKRYPWSLRVDTLELADLESDLSAYSDTVTPLRASLTVDLFEGAQQFKLHALILGHALESGIESGVESGVVINGQAAAVSASEAIVSQILE